MTYTKCPKCKGKGHTWIKLLEDIITLGLTRPFKKPCNSCEGKGYIKS